MFTMLDKFENEMHLSQLVNINTWRRVVRGELRTSLLDHVYENAAGLVESVTEILTSTSDHTPLLINLAMKIEHNSETRVLRDWSKYSKERLLELLSKKIGTLTVLKSKISITN